MTVVIGLDNTVRGAEQTKGEKKLQNRNDKLQLRLLLDFIKFVTRAAVAYPVHCTNDQTLPGKMSLDPLGRWL